MHGKHAPFAYVARLFTQPPRIIHSHSRSKAKQKKKKKERRRGGGKKKRITYVAAGREREKKERKREKNGTEHDARVPPRIFHCGEHATIKLG